ncbi:GSCFA domain-containing protein [Cellulophaga sp. E16_2]|uniref:GSCFA domain protein n=1 Tax=Cellulophaga algicola (strain DSM 14237 / IC166 / ACAM 630) TaxID=688270 RepID=E6XET3_CELAD|nr:MULTISPECIES: GSCFA domain-containing protein [Cellulophaga]ADV48135.1 GSCFA domain protein [Cellulophaga algicola DSM 14237]MBO0590576.1 GSCFA domain-containing protein [Cellulophaga sp. E16_2]
MKLQTEIPLTKAKHQIDYNSQLLLLGSCFVENIGDRFTYFKFQSVQNPFGILFHPLAIENLIFRALSDAYYTEDDIFYLNEKWQCFDAHSDLSANTKEALLANLNKGLKVTQEQLKQASHLIITLGTAWGYKNLSTENVVANCHKVPQKEFSKDLLSVGVIQESLERIIARIRTVNSTVQFIFTVSPVRHIKDGFIENQQSKAHLITAIHQVIKRGGEGYSYFPSYELMMDELRDYRFYAEDMVHPNNLAITYIWEKFKAVWVSETVFGIINGIDIIQRGLSHRAFNPKSEQHQKFLKALESKITSVQKEYPFMKFNL